ncbi:hypothetical protein LINPERHAP1_LOCUS7233 [Linum perenne]
MDIPTHLRSEALINRIGTNYFPSLLVIEPTGLDRNRWSRAVKVFAEITMADPLMTHINLDMPDGEDQKVKFKYERIQAYYIYCGRIGHTLEICRWRRDDMNAGMSGIPSGEFRLSIKVGVFSNSSLEDETDYSDGSDRFIPGPGLVTRGDGNRRRIPTATDNFASPTASSASIASAACDRPILPDLNSRTTTPELITPTLQMLFPESPNNPRSTPNNLIYAFNREASHDLNFSPMSPLLPYSTFTPHNPTRLSSVRIQHKR